MAIGGRREPGRTRGRPAAARVWSWEAEAGAQRRRGCGDGAKWLQQHATQRFPQILTVWILYSVRKNGFLEGRRFCGGSPAAPAPAPGSLLQSGGLPGQGLV